MPRSTAARRAARAAVDPLRGASALVVDSHLHVWNAETAATPWRPGWARFAHSPSFEIEPALAAMDDAGVDRAVLLAAAWDRFGNELVERAASAHPDRFAAFPSVDVRKPMPSEALREWRSTGARSGLRLMLPPGVQPSWLEDGSAAWLWPAAEESSTPLMVWMPGQLGHLQPILRAHPELKVAVDHLNITMDAGISETARAVTELCGLARFPNLSAKVSALPCSATDGYPFRSVFPLVRQVIDSFGAERVFWGSDLNRLPCTYRQAVTMFTEEMPMLTDRETRLVMGDALSTWLGWQSDLEGAARETDRKGAGS